MLDKPSYSPNIKQAEYTMWGLHYKRYNSLLEQADKLALMVRPPNIDFDRIPDYHSILKQIYVNYRPLLNQETRDGVETFFDKIEEQLEKFSKDNINPNQKSLKIDRELIKSMENMHMKLLEIQQIAGLGVNVKITQKLKETFKKLLLGET